MCAQFDFHQYCLRKLTLRPYIRTLRMEDKLQSHDFFMEAAVGAIECYKALHANPSKAAGDGESGQRDLVRADVRKKRVSFKAFHSHSRALEPSFCGPHLMEAAELAETMRAADLEPRALVVSCSQT